MASFVLPRQPLILVSCAVLFCLGSSRQTLLTVRSFHMCHLGQVSFFHTSDLLLALFSSLITHPSLFHLLLLPFLSPHHFPPHLSLPPFIPSSLSPSLPPSLSPSLPPSFPYSLPPSLPCSLSLSFHIFVLPCSQLFFPTHSFYPLSLRPPPVCRREFCLCSDQDHLVCSPTEV